MEEQSKVSTQIRNIKNQRQARFQNIRSNMKDFAILKKNTTAIQQKIQKKRKRRQSIQINNIPIIQNIDQQPDSTPCRFNTFDQKYQLLQKIGEGAHGVVKKCMHKQKQMIYAVKIIHLNDQHIVSLKNNFVDIKSLKHQNIIKYKAMYFDYQKHICYLVMEYINMPNLLQVQIYQEQEVQIIVFQILQALVYIHQRNICHRDLKPQNILYDQKTKKIKIIDFGISKNLKKRGRIEQMLTVTGTLYYRAPQMFNGGGYDQKVDLWALGITMYKIICGVTPFQSEYLSQTLQNIQNKQIQFKQSKFIEYSSIIRTFILKLCKRSKTDRISAKQAIKDIWFSPGIIYQQSSELHKSSTIEMSRYTQGKSQNQKSDDFSMVKIKRKISMTKSLEKQEQQKQIISDKQKKKIKFNLLQDMEETQETVFNSDEDIVIQLDQLQA